MLQGILNKMDKKKLRKLIREVLKESQDWAKMRKQDALQHAWQVGTLDDEEKKEKAELRKQMKARTKDSDTYGHLGGKPDWLMEEGNAQKEVESFFRSLNDDQKQTLFDIFNNDITDVLENIMNYWIEGKFK